MHNRGGDLGGLVGGDDHAMHTHDFSSAQQGAQVLRILDDIQQQEKGRFRFCLAKGNQILQGGVRILTGLKGHALVMGGEAIQLFPGDFSHGQATFLGKGQNLGQPGIQAGTASQHEPEEMPAISLE